MYGIRLLLMFFLSLVSLALTSSISVSTIFILFFFIGRLTITYFQPKAIKKDALTLFDISYISSFIYALMLFAYMDFHGYNHMQSHDGIAVYIPYTYELLNTHSILELIHAIYWGEFSWKYSFVGSILILFVYIGKLSSLMDGELYVNIQLGIILFSSWISVVIYNILIYNKIANKKALTLTLVYMLLSIQFLNSAYIVRDMPITLFFLLLIYFSFKPFSFKRFSLMMLLVFLIATLRLSSAIFALAYIVLVLIMSTKDSNSLRRTLGFIILFTGILIGIAFMDVAISTYELKKMAYDANQNNAGPSTVAMFDALPPGVSHLIKAFYNQIMPIPSWRSMIQVPFYEELYNIMNFPAVPATLFRYYIWFIIIIGIGSKKIRNLIVRNKLLFYNILIAILLLALQSNSMGHRRLLGVYPIFFLLAILIYQNLNKKNKKIALYLPAVIFMLFQIIGIVYM